ncbi:MAG: AAA family ATPase [Caldilineaceae bacterium]
MNETTQQTRPLRLVAVMGLPGAGKSAAAHLIAQRIDAVLLRSDVIRKEIYPVPRYTPEEGRNIYQEMFDRSATLLARGQSVVLDAMFRADRLRRQAQRIADEAGASWWLVLVTAPEDVIRRRLATRRDDPSDADFEIYRLLRAEFESIATPHEVIDNAGTSAQLAERVAQIFTA